MTWRIGLLASLIVLPACSAGGGTGAQGAPVAVGGSTSSGGGSGSGAIPSSGSGGDSVVPVPVGTTDPPLDSPDGACAAQVAGAENATQEVTENVTEEVPQPVAIYIMLDQSASMIGTKWTAAVSAITAFLTDKRSAGIDVAFHVFPNNLPPLPSGCANCDGSDCATPMYPVGQLPAAAQAITGDLSQRVPFGLGTPIEAGLRGATQFCTGFQGSHPDEKCVVLFITDGAPAGCAGDTPTLTQIVSDAHAGGVTTFTVGMAGADFTLLDQLAQAGGSDCTPNDPSYACNVTSNQDFLAALEGIRSTITVTHTVTHTVTTTKPVACEYSRPDPPAGQTFDKSQVNVEFTIAGVTTKVLHTQSAATCPAEGGWYYDDDNNPTKILICPGTCNVVQSTTDVAVRVLFGCATEEVPA